MSVKTQYDVEEYPSVESHNLARVVRLLRKYLDTYTANHDEKL